MSPQSVENDDQIWVDRLQRWGVSGIVPALLDVLRPVGLVGSQLIIMAKPILTTFVAAEQIDQFTTLIEDPERLARLRRALEAKGEAV